MDCEYDLFEMFPNHTMVKNMTTNSIQMVHGVLRCDPENLYP